MQRIAYPGHACTAQAWRGGSADIEFQIPPLSVLYLFYYLAARHVAAIGSPPLKYVVCGDVKVRDECVAYVIPT